MGAAERQQRQFLYVGRPGAAATALVVFGIFYVVSPSDRLARLLALLVVAIGVSALGALALRWFAVGPVARVSLGLDIVLIAFMIAALDLPAILGVPFFAPVAFAAVMFGARETAAYTVLGATATLLVGIWIDAGALTIVTDVLVLAITGAILGGLSRELHTAQSRLSREREVAAAALQIAERVRTSLDVESIVSQTVEEVGRACAAARGILWRPDEHAPVYQWTRDGVAPVEVAEVPPPVRRVAELREPLVVSSLKEVRDDPALSSYLEMFDTRALVAYPLFWHDRVLAVLALHDDRERSWDDALPLLDRLAPQVAAALVQAELYLQQRETAALRETLVANVSHELRTPLTATIGFLRTLERPDIQLSDEQRREFLSVARQEAERLARLVGDLLQLTRLERGTISLIRERTPIAHVVARAAAGVEVPEGRRLRLEVPEDVVAPLDGDRMLQVFSNLLMNGFRHGDGDVIAAAERVDGTVRVTISDEGEGVDPANVASLFEPFARWSKHRESSGLGLAIARRLVEAHGGTLTYRLRDGDRPHAFVVELPAG